MMEVSVAERGCFKIVIEINSTGARTGTEQIQI
jgi:hypothetical protein